MKKSKILLCYIPVFIGVIMYSQAVLVNLLIGFVCFITGIYITASAADMK